MLTHPIDCPACGAQHDSSVRLGAYPVLACSKVTPTGATQFYPKKGVVVVGAGMWVDETPAVELTAEQMQARIASLKSAKLSANPEPVAGAKSLDDLKAELAALEAP
jgi:hypothetical protein